MIEDIGLEDASQGDRWSECCGSYDDAIEAFYSWIPGVTGLSRLSQICDIGIRSTAVKCKVV